ncbi:hypothetical protein [Tissierella sp.]|uniref:hypothetical protein n=1 Tax=Tissierella sp. TaxID=41274 RepID=UPI003068FB02
MKTLYAKIIKRAVYIFFIAFVLIYTIPFPINKELDAVEIKLDDPSYLETRKIHISGTYRLNLFTDNTFQGQIFVPEYELTSGKMDEIQFMKDIDNGCPLVYKNEIGAIADDRPLEEDYSFGRILSRPLFHRMVILVYGESKGDVRGWNSDTGYCIVPSVSNREEALKVLEKYDIFSSKK